MDRRYVVKDRTIEVINQGRSHGSKDLDPTQAARIDELAAHAAEAKPSPSTDLPISDGMETNIAILADTGSKNRLQLRTGDDAPAEVWSLIGEVSRASGA